MKGGYSFNVSTDQPPGYHAGDEKPINFLSYPGLYNVASGIYYNQELWVFVPGNSEDTIEYRRPWIFYSRLSKQKNYWGWESGKTIKNSTTHFAPSPVIFRQNLFIFWVGETGSLYYTHNLGKHPKEEELTKDEWDEIHEITVCPQGEVSPVYNPELDRLEVYYRVKNENAICYVSTKDANTWTDEVRVGNLDTPMAPSAVAVKNSEGKYRIMLAHRSYYDKNTQKKDEIYICFVNNGKFENGYFLKDTTHNPPHLVNLGNGSIALIYGR